MQVLSTDERWSDGAESCFWEGLMSSESGAEDGRCQRHWPASPGRSRRLAISMPATSGQCQASPDPDGSAAPLSWAPAESKLSVASSDKAGVIGGWGEVMERLETLLLPGSRRVSALCHRSSHCACPESASGR